MRFLVMKGRRIRALHMWFGVVFLVSQLWAFPTTKSENLRSKISHIQIQTMSYWNHRHRPINNDDEDVDDFDEFDPTPYGGGYDIKLTYGRPVKPSEETCYHISSGGDNTVDYDLPNYSSYSEPSAYADEVLENEYSSYSRPKPGGGRRPSASGGPGPAYGYQPGMNRPEYGEEEVGSEYDELPPPVEEFGEEERANYEGEEGYEGKKYKPEMDEEATPTRVPPASPLTKSGGGNNRSESPGGKVVPHYLRASTGSCHELCKHGRQEEHVSGVKDSRPWRKLVAGNGREDGGVTSSIKKTVVVKSKPSTDHKIKLVLADMSTTTDDIDHAMEHAAVTVEPYTSDGPETAVLSAERTKQESPMTSENVTMAAEGEPVDLNAKEFTIAKKSCVSSPGKPLWKSPLTISRGSSAARIVDVRKSMEVRRSLDGRQAFDERNKVRVRNTEDEMKGFDECNSVIHATEKCDGDGENAKQNYSEVCMSEDKTTSIEGSHSSVEIDNSEESNSLRSKCHTKDDSVGIGKISGQSESSKKQATAPKPVILKMKESSPSLTRVSAKPASPLHPSSASSRNSIAAKPPSPLHPFSVPSRNLITAKSPSPLHPSAAKSASPLHPSAAKSPFPLHPSSAPSRNPIHTKPSSPLHISSGTRSKTISNNQQATKLGTSKSEMKKVDTSVVGLGSPDSGSSVDGEEISNVKKVRVIRVASTVRRRIKVTNVAAKVPGDHNLKEDTTEPIKIAPAKKSAVNSKIETASDSLLTPVSKTTYKSRISHSPAEPGPKPATKHSFTLGPRKSKAVEKQPESHRPSTVKTVRAPLLRETAATTRRSLKKRISSGSGGIAIEKSSSGRFLSRRPSTRQKKNVQVLFNKVIEETASKLVRTSKSKVLALVGAFETVISIQRKSSAASTPKSEKKHSSSKTSA